jgi:hypothetical protein
MLIEDYSHMVMKNKNMADGDGVGGDDGDGEEALKIPSPEWRARSCSPQKQRAGHATCAHLWLAGLLVFPFGTIASLHEKHTWEFSRNFSIIFSV